MRFLHRKWLNKRLCRKSSNLRENKGEVKASTKKKEIKVRSNPSVTVADVNSCACAICAVVVFCVVDMSCDIKAIELKDKQKKTALATTSIRELMKMFLRNFIIGIYKFKYTPIGYYCQDG